MLAMGSHSTSLSCRFLWIVSSKGTPALVLPRQICPATYATSARCLFPSSIPHWASSFIKLDKHFLLECGSLPAFEGKTFSVKVWSTLLIKTKCNSLQSGIWSQQREGLSSTTPFTEEEMGSVFIPSRRFSSLKWHLRENALAAKDFGAGVKCLEALS